MSSDLDDTVSRPPRPRSPAAQLGDDLEDTTANWQRPMTAPIVVAASAVETPPTEPPLVEPALVEPALVEPPLVEPVETRASTGSSSEDAPASTGSTGSSGAAGDAHDDATVVSPPSLVEPPRTPPPAPGSAIPDVSDNIWSEPLPEKPLPFRIRLDDGTLVPLDQPVYLGRKPSVPRIHPGGIPLLVTFDSPQREVSSTHLMLSAVGGAIVATDLKSTNGSIVHVPGAAPRTLLGGESSVVTPGTIIELGDGNSIELLAPDHAAARSAQG